MVGNIHSSEYATLSESEPLVIGSYDNDGCAYLSYEAYCQRLLQDKVDFSQGNDEPKQLRLNRAIHHFSQNGSMNSYSGGVGTEIVAQINEKLVLTAAQFDKITQSFLKYGSLKHYRNRDNISKKHLNTLETMLQTHYKSFQGVDIIISGSNRQYYERDYSNSSKTGVAANPSGIHILAQMGHFLSNLLPRKKVKTDHFLLADLFDDATPGSTAKNIQKKLLPNGKYPPRTPDALGDYAGKPFSTTDGVLSDFSRYDEDKLTLLYAQMQYFANKYPNRTIQFKFFDDRLDILQALQSTFQDNPELIPQNITLELQQRDTIQGMPSSFAPQTINGNGPINQNWQMDCRYLIYQVNKEMAEDQAQAKNVALESRLLKIKTLTSFTKLAEICSKESKDPLKSLIITERAALATKITEKTARIAELEALKTTVQARNPRGAWRSSEAWADWWTRQTVSNFFSAKAWSDWATGQHNIKNEVETITDIKDNTKDRVTPIGLWAGPTWLGGESTRLDNLTNDVRLGATLPTFLTGCAWPTKKTVIDRIDESLQAVRESLRTEEARVIELHQQLVNDPTKAFMGAAVSLGFGQPFDLAGQCYQCTPITTQESSLNNSPRTVASAESVPGNSKTAKHSLQVMCPVNNTDDAQPLFENSGFTDWLNEDTTANARPVVQRLGVEKSWGREIADKLTGIQHTLDQHLTHALRTFAASVSKTGQNVTEPDLQHMFAIAREQLINDLRTQIQDALSKSYGNPECCLDAKGFSRLQTKLEQIHKKVPKMVLPVVAAQLIKLIKTPAFEDVFKKGTDSRTAIKEQSRPLYDALKAAAPTQPWYEFMPSFGNCLASLNPLNWGKGYRISPTQQ